MKNPNKLFPLFVSKDLGKTKAYYTEKLGFELVHDMEGYLQVRSGKDPEGPELAFMTAGPLPGGGDPGPFGGRGVIVSVPTPDADATARALEAKGVSDVTPPVDRPWGWRSFMVTDPNGVMLDFFHVVGDSA